MTLKIFLDDKSFHCLKHAIPSGSRSKLIIQKAVHLDPIESFLNWFDRSRFAEPWRRVFLANESLQIVLFRPRTHWTNLVPCFY